MIVKDSFSLAQERSIILFGADRSNPLSLILVSFSFDSFSHFSIRSVKNSVIFTLNFDSSCLDLGDFLIFLCLIFELINLLCVLIVCYYLIWISVALVRRFVLDLIWTFFPLNFVGRVYTWICIDFVECPYLTDCLVDTVPWCWIDRLIGDFFFIDLFCAIAIAYFWFEVWMNMTLWSWLQLLLNLDYLSFWTLDFLHNFGWLKYLMSLYFNG